MNGGRIEQIGTQTEIYLEPRTPFVAEFIGANNSLTGVVTAVGPGAGRTSAPDQRDQRRADGALPRPRTGSPSAIG